MKITENDTVLLLVTSAASEFENLSSKVIVFADGSKVVVVVVDVSMSWQEKKVVAVAVTWRLSQLSIVMTVIAPYVNPNKKLVSI